MSKSKTPLTDAVQEAFNKRDGMCVDDIIEAYEHARVLEMVVAKLRDRCARLKRQRDWLKLNANRYESPTVKLGLPKP